MWIALIVAVPLLWWLLKVFAAFAVPQKTAGVALLKQELARRGVNTKAIPAEFFNECVRSAEGVSAFRGQSSALKRKEEFVTYLEGFAILVRQWLDDPNHPTFQGEANRTAELLEKYFPRSLAPSTEGIARLSASACAAVREKWTNYHHTVRLKAGIPLATKIELFAQPLTEFFRTEYPELLLGGGKIFWLTIFQAILDSETHSRADVNAAIAQLERKFAN